MFDPLYDLTKDIRYLYAKTGHKGLENLFCVAASSYEQAFSGWLKSNSSITEQLTHTNTYQALLMLIRFKEKFPSGMSMSQLVGHFTGSSADAGFIPTVLSFIPLLNSDVEPILSPFADIILSFSAFQVVGTRGEETPVSESVSSTVVHDDLKLISDKFQSYIDRGCNRSPSGRVKPKRITKNDLRVKMLSYLVRRFSDELAKAASETGRDELAEQFRSGVILSNPDVLMKYIDTVPTSRFMWSLAENVFKEIDADIDNHEWGYEYAKERALHSAGEVSREELARLQKERDQSNSTVNTLMEAPDSFRKRNVADDNYPVLNVKAEQWLNPFTLSMIYAVLATFLNKVK